MKTSTRFKKKLLASLITASVAAVAAGTPNISVAASADANLRGHAAASAVITAKQISTGAVRRTKASTDGSYALVGLPPGTYQVDAGPGTERTVTLSVASTATLDLTAAPATAGAPSVANATNLNGVTVSATDLREVKTSEVGTTVSLHQINTTPQASRNFLEFADVVPGMVFTRSADGTTSLRAGAQASSAINVYIDGVGQKNYVLSGGITGQNASQGNPFPQLAVGEYKVITSNYKAEYDQISSAAVTAETKSGTNEFHGDVLSSFTDTAMRAETPAEQAADKKTSSHEKDYGFDLGGPIVKDLAHFFIAYEGKEFNSPTTVVPAGDASYISQLPASVQSLLGPASLPFKENDWFGKIDFEPTDRDRFEISGKYRDESSISGIGGDTAATAALNTKNFDKRFDIRWDHSTDSWFNRLQATYENAFYTPTPLYTGDGSAYVEQENQNQTILFTGNSPTAQQNKGQKGPALQDDLTFNDFEWHGDHVIKMGVKYKAVKLTAQDAGDSNALYNYAVTQNNGTESIPYQVQFGSPTPGLSPIAKSSDKQFGTYIQDDWAVNDKLTLNLGIRWDYEKTPSYLDYVTPANVIAAFNSQDPNAPAGQTYAQTLAKGGVNVNDYISTGSNRSAPKNEFQPRLGFSYDLNGDEAHVIFGGIGRSYDRDLYESLQVEQTKSVLSQPTLNFNTPDKPCVVGQNSCYAWNPAYYNIATLQGLVAGTTAGKEVDLITNNLKAPYSDQISIGMRNKVGDWNTSAAIASVRSYDGLVFTLGNRYPNGAFWENGSQPWGNGIPGFGSLIIGNNGLETKTTQVLLSAEKPYTKESGWGATFAYTYTHALQNNDNIDPTDQYAFDYETIGNYPYTGSGVSKHRLVATGTIDGPWGFVFGSKLTLSTPIPDLNLACYGATPTNQDGNGFNGGGCRSVSIAPPSTGRFLIGGKFFGYRDIDLQATKNFTFGGGIGGYVRLDLINVFNWDNYTQYIETFGTNGVLNRVPVIYNPIGEITGYPRTLKLSVGINF
ncbi:TonB-dependent receptor [Rhodanobacter sp. A1T4]|uniref:TonB-dependent receptor n=1 Tax=Rhodanobacter sp. A1T4 TaxID=2723087 RepID=UPI0016208636|nr:TonB-dependent receptor [Rhodanobacter sp. A1T4]MBB6247513.1 outer membrane receptor protein involved in Fe transport [Rhodanobacter sp. A1T4]